MKNIFLYIIILLASSCANTADEKNIPNSDVQNEGLLTLTNAQLKSAALEFASIESKDLSTVIRVNGKIDVPPQNMISVSMPLGGYLKSTGLLPGMHIRKGEIIATMEDQQYIELQQDYLIAKAKLEYAEAEYLRQKALNESKASSDKVFQQAVMEYHSGKVALSALAERLKLINLNPKTLSENNLSKSVNLYSPIDGFVSKINVNIGKYVTPADILFELVNPADIHLNLNIFEKDLSALAIGQKLLAYSNNQPEKKYKCEIILISKNLSEARTSEVHCHFEDYDNTLLPGMYMNADIEVKKSKVKSIPEEAVVNSEGKDYVFISLGKNQFQMTEVSVGTSENGFIEIRNPEALDSKTIVTKGAYALLMALKNKEDE